MSGGRSSRDKGMVAHKRIVSECALHIGDPSLSKEDVLTGADDGLALLASPGKMVRKTFTGSIGN